MYQDGRPTLAMMKHGGEIIADGKHFVMSIRKEGILYLPADAFLDFPNITVC